MTTTLPTVPARILVLGSGGREHALAWRFAGEAGVAAVVVAPGSAAIAAEPGVVVAAVDPLDPGAVVALARHLAVDLVVIGPEAPLAAGVADALDAASIPVFGPSAAAARIETSKSICRGIAAAAGVRIARGGSFTDPTAARAFASELVAAPGSIGVVVKADGLAAGKGVTVCGTVGEAEAALDVIFGGAGGTAVVEERLEGPEASLIALCDGTVAVALAPARDHKRLLDGDDGPNTGGMGAYSPLPDLSDADAAHLVATVHQPVLAELARRGTPFRGALYAGLMLTATGPVLLEFNARFGDPETQVILPRAAVPLAPLMLAAARGDLGPALRDLGVDGALLPSTPTATVGIVFASAGYPVSHRSGDPIEGLAAAAAAGALVFHAGTRPGADGGFVTAGGRVLSVVAIGDDLRAARVTAERAASLVHFPGAQRRRDIAAGTLASPVARDAR